MSRIRVLPGILLVVVLLTTPAFTYAMPSASLTAQGTNLLQNPGFEMDWSVEGSHRCLVNSQFRDVGNIFTPPKWITWFRHEPGVWDQPEVTDTVQITDRRRTRTGTRSMRLFTFYRKHDGGFYQVVSGLEPGATVQFSAYGEGWSCDLDDNNAMSCGDEWTLTFQVGIEPNGVADPFSPGVIWSPETPSLDEFHLIGPVTAQVGESGTVVVFLRSIAHWPVKHNDAYWDDASLVVVSPGSPPTDTPPPPPPTPTYGPSPTPRPTPTPRPDGAIVHVVEAGDTLYGIAFEYGVDIEQLRRLNAGTLGPNDMLSIGQEIIVSIPNNAATATPLPPPTTAAPATAAPGGGAATTPSPSPGGGGGAPAAQAGASICVLAYHDRNGNTFRDSETDEELLPNAEFIVADANGIIAQYTSDGVHEPYCFTGLAPGAYRVIQTAPPGYEPSGPSEWPVAVAEGTGLDIQFGDKRSAGEATGEEAGAAEQPSPSDEGEAGNSATTSKVAGIFSTIAKISGVLMLLLALGVAVLFFVNRRRM